MKKISYKEIKSSVKDEHVYSDVCLAGTKGDVIVSIKKSLSLAERGSIVNDISSIICRTDKDGNVIYAPYLAQFAVDFSIANYFTNISIPKDPDEAWMFIKEIDIISIVREQCGNDYINGIIDDAMKMTEYRKECSVKNKRFDKVFDSVNDILKTLNSKLMDLSTNDIIDGIISAKDVVENFEDSENSVEISPII